MSKSAKATMTIGELARQTGMTVRNIRAHQTRGLLPPPEVRGRTGYYGEEHVARIALTRDMQADGFNLEAIRRLLDTVDGSATDVVDFTRALRAPFEDETPEIIDVGELVEMWGGGDPQPELLGKAEKLGVLRALPDGRIEVISPRLHRAGAELAGLGVSPEAALATVDKLRRHASGASRVFVDLFVKEVWEPFNEAGRPEKDWPKIRETLERLRPLASDALLAIFQIAMSEATEKESERTIALEARKQARRGSRRAR